VLMSIKYVSHFRNGIRIASVIYYWSADSSYLFTGPFLESREGKWNSNVDIYINPRSTAYLNVSSYSTACLNVSSYVVMLIVTVETHYVWLPSSLA
jgi:hypothetical protein